MCYNYRQLKNSYLHWKWWMFFFYFCYYTEYNNWTNYANIIANKLIGNNQVDLISLYKQVEFCQIIYCLLAIKLFTFSKSFDLFYSIACQSRIIMSICLWAEHSKIWCIINPIKVFLSFSKPQIKNDLQFFSWFSSEHLIILNNVFKIVCSGTFFKGKRESFPKTSSWPKS